MTAAFDSFWQAYPKREGKAACVKKWEAKRLDDTAPLIVAHLQKRVREDRKWRDGYVPAPLTFLSQERWTDEYETYQPRQPAPARTDSPLADGPQHDHYKALLNLALLKMVMNVQGGTLDGLRRAVRVRNEIAAEMRQMWGETANNDELKDLSAGYLAKLRAALVHPGTPA